MAEWLVLAAIVLLGLGIYILPIIIDLCGLYFPRTHNPIRRQEINDTCGGFSVPEEFTVDKIAPPPNKGRWAPAWMSAAEQPRDGTTDEEVSL